MIEMRIVDNGPMCRPEFQFENPSEGAIIEHIEDAVMSAIHEYFTFDEDECR